jgi:hypothetical protein
MRSFLLPLFIIEMTIYRQIISIAKIFQTPVEKSVIPINKAILNAFR